MDERMAMMETTMVMMEAEISFCRASLADSYLEFDNSKRVQIQRMARGFLVRRHSTQISSVVKIQRWIRHAIFEESIIASNPPNGQDTSTRCSSATLCESTKQESDFVEDSSSSDSNTSNGSSESSSSSSYCSTKGRIASQQARGKDSVNSSREHLQHLLACCMQYQLPQFAIVVVLLLIPLLLLPETTFVEHHHEHYFAHQQKLRTKVDWESTMAQSKADFALPSEHHAKPKKKFTFEVSRDTSRLARRSRGSNNSPVVDCQVSAWSRWSNCSTATTCVDSADKIAHHVRSRLILVQPANGGAACPSMLEMAECPAKTPAKTPAKAPASKVRAKVGTAYQGGTLSVASAHPLGMESTEAKAAAAAAAATMQTDSVPMQTDSVPRLHSHPCDDGSHGCHDPVGGGICFKVGSSRTHAWSCGCVLGYICTAGCSAPFRRSISFGERHTCTKHAKAHVY
jgi:hypothetical protein